MDIQSHTKLHQKKKHTGCAKTSWTLQQNDSTSGVTQNTTILRPFLEFSAIFTLEKVQKWTNLDQWKWKKKIPERPLTLALRSFETPEPSGNFPKDFEAQEKKEKKNMKKEKQKN